MAKGNPNPSPATRFVKGQSGNPSGRSKAEQEAHHKAAAIAAELKLKALSCLQDKVSEGDDGEGIDADAVISMLFNPDVQRMFKEVEDRAHGTPKQAIDHTSSDRSMTPPAPSDITPEAVAALVKELKG